MSNEKLARTIDTDPGLYLLEPTTESAKYATGVIKTVTDTIERLNAAYQRKGWDPVTHLEAQDHQSGITMRGRGDKDNSIRTEYKAYTDPKDSGRVAIMRDEFISTEALRDHTRHWERWIVYSDGTVETSVVHDSFGMGVASHEDDLARGKTERKIYDAPRHRFSSGEQATIDQILSILNDDAALLVAA